MTTIYILIVGLTLYYSSDWALQAHANVKELERRRLELIKAQQIAYENGKHLSPNSNVIKDYKKALPASPSFMHFVVLLGHMLGDCSVKYNPTSDQASLAFEWGNKEYAYYVYNMFKDYILSPPREQTRVNAYGNSVTTYCFQTVTLPCFAIYYHLFIVNGVKTVPVGLVSCLLAPQGLATWYMDDGGLTTYLSGHGMSLQLNTQSFTTETVNQLVTELNERYDLNCRMRILKNKGGKPIIVIPSASYPKFYKIVSPYIHKSMSYKLPTLRLRKLYIDPKGRKI